ncbi:MAG: outer membrane protein [Bdellovibrionales bacterium]
MHNSQCIVDAVWRAAIFFVSLVWCFPAAAQDIDWRGAYIGGFGGAARADRPFATELSGEWSNPANPLNQEDRDALLPLLNRGQTTIGATGGAATGYNWQMDNLLLGVEADYSAIDGKNKTTGYVTAVSPYRVDTSTDIDWIATLRGRLGITHDRTLAYITGGLAFGDPSFNQTITQLNFPYVETGTSNATKMGWALGAGLEHALDDAWSFRLQYLHIDLGSQSTDTGGVCPPPDVATCGVYTGSRRVGFTLDSMTAGISYRFTGL